MRFWTWKGLLTPLKWCKQESSLPKELRLPGQTWRAGPTSPSTTEAGRAAGREPAPRRSGLSSRRFPLARASRPRSRLPRFGTPRRWDIAVNEPGLRFPLFPPPPAPGRIELCAPGTGAAALISPLPGQWIAAALGTAPRREDGASTRQLAGARASGRGGE